MESRLLKYTGRFCLLFMLLAIWGCTLIPCDCYSDMGPLTVKPKTNFIAGLYQLDDWTLQNLKGCNAAQNAIFRIKPDGTFEMRNIPMAILSYNAYYKSTDEKLSVNGTWSAVFDKGTAKLSVDFNYESQAGFGKIFSSWNMYIKNQKPVILIIVGDPDECAAARFERISK